MSLFTEEILQMLPTDIGRLDMILSQDHSVGRLLPGPSTTAEGAAGQALPWVMSEMSEAPVV